MERTAIDAGGVGAAAGSRTGPRPGPGTDPDTDTDTGPGPIDDWRAELAAWLGALGVTRWLEG